MKYCLLLLSTLFLQHLHAQSNYQKGFVVTPAGDTLNGLIDYREWNQNPTRISFKRSVADNQVITFDATTARSFSLPGYESFTAAVVAISKNDLRFDYLTETADTTTDVKAVFLKELLTGDRLNLYSYTDNLKERFYISDHRQTVPRELELRKTVKNMQENTVSVYRQQLQMIAVSYDLFTPRLEQLIQQAGYNADDLKTVVGKINTVNNTGAARLKENKRSMHFFLGAGVQRNTIRYTGDNLITINGIDANGENQFRPAVTTTAYQPRLAAGMDFYLNPAIQKLVFRAELAFAPLVSTATSFYKFSSYTNEGYDYRYNLSGYTLSVIPQFLLNVYNTPSVKAFLAAGVAFNRFQTTKNSLEKKDHNGTAAYAEVEKNYVELKDISMQAIGRAGVQWKPGFELSLTWGNTIERTDYSVGKTSLRSGLLALSAAFKFGASSSQKEKAR